MNSPLKSDIPSRVTSTRGWHALRVGLFIAGRQIRANVGTSLLITLVMTLTYLNLLVVSGIMVGIVEGLRDERVAHYSGEVLITDLSQKDSIQNSYDMLAYLRALSDVSSFSPRYIANGELQANYASKLLISDKADTIPLTLVGIDPTAEDETTQMSQLIIEGQYLEPYDYDYILIGTSLLARYEALTGTPGSTPLPGVGVGNRVRVVVGGTEREMTVKGVVASKIQELNLRAFVVDTQLRLLIGRAENNVNEIAVRLSPEANAEAIQNQIQQSSTGANANIELARESEPAFFEDFSSTFNRLGSILGGIGLVIAFVAIFILVFINVVTRRRSIGIMHAIGIRPSGIKVAYVTQSVLYAVVGTAIGVLINFAVLQPYFIAHPINFPFSNGILSVPLPDALVKALVLILAIVLASYIPARMITRQKIVDAVLGR